MSKLIETTKQIEASLPVERLEQEGYKRDRREYEFIVTYPPISAMKPMSQRDIFFGTTRERDVNFYVHIPFCTGECTYCGRFERFPRQNRQTTDEYLTYLEKERDIMDTLPELQRMRVSTLYIGGGTPTYLSTGQLGRLTKFLTASLDAKKVAEFTVEGSPETITKEKLEVLLQNGVNRFSMGVQSFHNDTLEMCGRRHNAERARKSARLVREVGFRKFNIDLMSGLPYQTLERFEEDLNAAFDCGVSCVTIYPMYIRPGCKMAEFDDLVFPNQKDSLLMQIMAKEFFKERGWKEDPIHFFAPQGTTSNKLNMGKWGKGEEVLGLGVSTYQFMNNTQYHNLFDMQEYRARVLGGELPIWVGKKLEKEEQMTRFMVLGMKNGFVDVATFFSKFNSHPESIYPHTIQRLKDLGLIIDTTDEHEIVDELRRIELTNLGSLFSEEVAIQFFTDATRRAIGNRGYAGYSIAELPKFNGEDKKMPNQTFTLTKP